MQKVLTSLGIAILSVVSFTWFTSTPVSAVTPPDTCFAFDSATGTITKYYKNESNNISNPVCPKDVEIPSSIGGVAVGSIYHYAFHNNQLTSINIPSSVASIGSDAFSNNQLTSLTIPDSVTTLGSSAFLGNQITSVTISNHLTYIDRNTFMYNRLTTVTVPDSVTNIHPYAFGLQNPWGGDLDTATNGAPDMWTVSPSEAQQVYDSIWYVRLYTANPSNPNHLYSGAVNEDWWFGNDKNANNQDDSLGGHLINPTSVSMSFVDDSGVEVQASTSFVGMLSDGTMLHDYLVSKGPNIPGIVDSYAITPAEQSALDTALAAYYRIGDTFTYTAPLINGITPTPASYSFVLGATNEVNTKTFVYSAATAPATGNGLANTGTSLTTMLIAAASLILVSVFLGLYRYKVSRSV